MKKHLCFPLFGIVPLFIVFTIFCVSFNSCNRTHNNESSVLENGIEDIVVIDDKTTNVGFQEFIDDVSYVAFETTKESLISSVDKLILGDSTILIWDNKIHEVFLFNKKGEFLHKIDQKGKGPNEYTNVTDVILNERENQILMLDPSKHSILYFDLNGNFNRSISVHDFEKSGTSFTLFNDKWIYNRYLYRLDDNYLAVFGPETAKFEQSLVYNLLKTVSGGHDFIHNFSSFKDTLYYLGPMSNTIYAIDKNYVSKKRYSIDFKKSNPDYERLNKTNFSSVKHLDDFLNQNNYSIFLENLLITEKYIHFTSLKKNGFHTLIYSKEHDRAKVFSSVKGDLDRYVWSSIRATTKEGEFVSIIDNPENVLKIIITQKTGRISDLQSNPILAFYKLNDDYFRK